MCLINLLVIVDDILTVSAETMEYQIQYKTLTEYREIIDYAANEELGLTKGPLYLRIDC